MLEIPSDVVHFSRIFLLSVGAVTSSSLLLFISSISLIYLSLLKMQVEINTRSSFPRTMLTI